MSYFKSSLACLGLAGVLLSGCGDSFSPTGVAGDYDLITVNGVPPEVTQVGLIKLRESGNFLRYGHRSRRVGRRATPGTAP